MKKQHTKKQIEESIKYWQKKLDEIDESTSSKIDDPGKSLVEIAKRAGIDEELAVKCIGEMLIGIINRYAYSDVDFYKAEVKSLRADDGTYIHFSFSSDMHGHWESVVNFYWKEDVEFEIDEGGIDEEKLRKELPKYMMDTYGIEVDDIDFSIHNFEYHYHDAEQLLTIGLSIPFEMLDDWIESIVEDVKANIGEASKSKAKVS